MLLYFKQAWHILKQNRFYSVIYILATGLSIAMVMVLAIVLYLKVANIYPETDRDRLLILHNAKTITADGSGGYSLLSLETVRNCIYSLQTAEAVAAVYNTGGGDFVQPDNSPEQIPTVVKCVDTGFWKVFTFSFLEGSPFTEADMQSGIRTVVISESFARQLFGTTEVTGKYISLNFDAYRICGVVKDVSTIAERTFAQLWMPYTAYPKFTPAWNPGRYENTLGSFTGYALAPSIKDVNKVKEEMQTHINRYKASLTEVDFSVYDQPDRQWESSLIRSGGKDLDSLGVLSVYGLIFLLLLLIPAVSLSGIADSQMDRRLPEMGIRRTFGAMRGGLLKQLVMENLLFTFLGGIAGLLFSYLFVYLFRGWIIHITGQSVLSLGLVGIDVAISPSMLINYTIFGLAFVICLVFNLMTTLIPAWRASRRQIVYSLNSK